MADIKVISQVSADVYRVDVTVTSLGPIADPIAYVSSSEVSNEILAKAGLSDTLIFVAASLNAARIVGEIREYDLTVTYDNTPALANGHQHDHTTLFFPLRESYRDGAGVDLEETIGPVVISADAAYTDDFFRVVKGTDDLLHIKNSGDIRFGGHLELFPDATYDIGTPDEGTLLRRPRDIRLSRDLYIGRNILSDGEASFAEGVLAKFSAFTAQASNPDTDAGSRHLYWNSGDNELHAWDGAVDSVVGGSAAPSTGQFTCPSAVQVQDAVYISASGEVSRANAVSSDRVIGFVISKPTSFSCIVQFSGEVGGFAGALISNSNYFLSLIDGQITPNPMTLTAGSWSHFVGVSRDINTLVTRFEVPTQI
jgi:hypothetical protein